MSLTKNSPDGNICTNNGTKKVTKYVPLQNKSSFRRGKAAGSRSWQLTTM